MSNKEETIKLKTPELFTFGEFTGDDFDRVLGFFDWTVKKRDSAIKFAVDFARGSFRDEKLILLLILYLEYLRRNELSLFLSENSNKQIRSDVKTQTTEWETIFESGDLNNQLLVINNSDDREKALECGNKYTEDLGIEYEKTLRHLLNELLYNTLEHGRNGHKIPSMLQFFRNEETNELSFIIADVGIGIKEHLRQSHPSLASDAEAILLSLKPETSGTFGKETSSYQIKNNMGVGLFFSSNFVQRLNADMFIVSGNGFVHISPTGIDSKELKNQWKGTFVYVKIQLSLIPNLNYQKMMQEIKNKMETENKTSEPKNLCINIKNYFGSYAEDKELAKKIRDKYILPAINEDKMLTLDFEGVVLATHSLLNAMLATPITRLGLSAYKKIKVINAVPEIREMIDFIFDRNTSNA
jgi:anti-sigma regulatory factor (Ser/Thr protein kinase)